MKIILKDETALINLNFIQSLCLLYFPCEKFSKDTEDTKSVICTLSVKDGLLVGNVQLTVYGKSYCYTQSEPAQDCVSRELAKRVMGFCFVKAAQKAFGFIPPWGIQTGIRPAKALKELCSGLSDTQKEQYMLEKYLTQPNKTRICTDIDKYELKAVEKLENKDFSLYISIPFCPSRCTYCSFVSYTTKRLISLIPEYVERLCEDIERLALLVKKRKLVLKTVYFGGGTPTTLNSQQLSAIIDKIHSCFDMSRVCEFTVEAGRPDTVTKEKLAALKNGGVDRISINTQSADNEVLRTIGRTHTFEDYVQAIELARQVGFKTINTDMIAGLPGESLENFKTGLEKVIDLKPENITVHSFTVKRSSSFKHEFLKQGKVCGEIFDMIDFSQKALSNSMYHPYYIYRQKNTAGNAENVGFSLDGHDGLYNIYIMEEYHTIFALGAGAVTKLVTPDRKIIERIFCPKYPYEFLDKSIYSGFAVDKAGEFYDKYFD